ncbi:hypothetical protein Tco_0496526 [Tanacetum coccineum]
MQNLKDNSDPTTAMNKELALMAKAFKLNTIPTNNNQRSSLITRNSQIAQPDMNMSQDIKMQMVDDNVGNQVRQNAMQNYENKVGQNEVKNSGIQNVENMNGLIVVSEISNQYGNENVVTAPAEGNGNGINAYNDMQQKIERLQAQLGDLKAKTQLFDKVSEPKGTTKGTRTNTRFTKQSILGKPPSSSSSGSKLYSVTPFPKSSVLPKVDKANALSKLVTSNSTPSTRESKVVQRVNVITPRIFRPNPSKTAGVDNVVPKNPVNNNAKTRRPHPRSNSNTDRVPSKSKSSCLSNNVEKIEENHRNSQIPKNQKHMSSECNNITLAIRNAKSEIVCVMCKQCLVTANHDVCVLNYVNKMNSRADNQSANVTIRENQKKCKENAKNSKELGSKGSLASSRPSKPRTCPRWIPTGRIFAMCGKITASSNIENKSEKSMCDNASTSNPSEPSSNGFLISTSLLGRYDSHDVDDRVGKSIRSFVRRIIQMEKVKLFQSLPLLLLLMHPLNVNNNKIQLHLLQL